MKSEPPIARSSPRRTRTTWSSGIILATALLSHAVTVATAQQPQPQRAQGTVTDGVTAVLVDIVVRDRRGQPVRDLTEADFEILEDGAAQSIGSFTRVFELPPSTSPAASAAVPSSTAAGVTINPGPGVTAIVFDRLQPESRRLAAQAAKNYLGSKEESADFVAVYGIDLGLTPYVPFTRNAVALRKALDAMMSNATVGFTTAEQRQAIADATQLANSTAAAANAATAGATGPGASAAIGSSPAQAQFAAMQAQALKDFEAMDRDQQGYATTNALYAIVQSLGRIPGRKSLVLFSEGIAIPDAVERFYYGLIDAANRSNVSIYTMDAVGLRSTSEQARVRDAVNAAGQIGINTGYAGDVSGTSPLTSTLEGNSYAIRSDPAYSLGELASGTGGISFNNTNNLKPAFERVEADLRNYYLIGYTPTNTTYDGKFRSIEVKVKRSGLTVAARKGYFAVRDPGGAPVNSWEAPALAALEQKPGNAFPFRASAPQFPERGRPGLLPVLVDLKTAPLSFQPTPDGKSYTSDFTVLIRFLDEKNLVARKVSQHYEIRGPIDQIERAKQGEVLFYRESELPPGVYRMETIVYDAPSGKSSVRFSTVEMPKYDESEFRMSSLVLVKRSEKAAEKDRPAGSPLLVKDILLYPNLGDPVSKASRELGFYFTIYPAPKQPSPESALELALNGKVLARVPMPVGATDASGRVQQLGRLPLDQLEPGTYELRAIVTQGGRHLVRTTMVRIEP